MTFVVDASVAVKWHVAQPGSDEARALGNDRDLIAPELILAEVANALWKYVRAGQLSADLAGAMIAKSAQPFTTLIPLQMLQSRAFTLACELNHPAYDCFYLALAEQERAPLVTADKRLATAATSISTVEVRLLVRD